MSVSILFYSRTVRAGFTECIDCKIINDKCDLYMYYFLLVERACIFCLLQSKRGAQYICVSTYIVNTVHTIFVHIVVFILCTYLLFVIHFFLLHFKLVSI